MTRPARCRQSEIERVIKVAIKHGLLVIGVTIQPDGTTQITTSDSTAPPLVRTADQAKAETV